MLLRKMEEFEQMSFKEKSAILDRLAQYPALTLMVWCRGNIGSRLLAPGIGVICFILIICCAFINSSDHRIMFFTYAVLTLGMGIDQRIKRWREFRRGVRNHSYYLGDSGFARFTPQFLRRRRFAEHYLDPLFFLMFGAWLLRYFPPLGAWIMLAAVSLGAQENAARYRHDNETRDLVDNMVSADVQMESVERFSDTAPPQPHHQQASGAIPTGLSRDIAQKIQRPQR